MVLLTLLGGTMVTSVWASNLVWVLLLANWVLEGRWREKWQMARESRLLQAWLALYAVLVIGMAWTQNTGHGLDVLRVKLPMLALPLIILTTRPLEGRARRTVLWLYAGTVLVVSIIGFVRLTTIAGLPYREAIPYLSHIRFALNCCMVFYICIGTMIHWQSRWRWLALPVGLWMLAFLVMLHSYTALAVLTVVSIAILLTHYRRWWLIAAWAAVAVAVAVILSYEVHSYYRMVPMATEPLKAATANGNPYSHAEDGIIENGNYMNNYVCREELRKEWNNRSTLPYDGHTESGYTVESTLVRYLNALGQTKDSVGMAAMSDADIAAVERGVANPVYESGNVVKKMVYVMLLEREFYVHTHAVAGFTMLQRFELWRTTADIVKENPVLGVGTGDVDDELHAQLYDRGSELSGTSKRSHNQYLSLMAAVGLLGFAVILFMFIRAAAGNKAKLSPLMLAWLITILISCLTEDTLDTLAGILFCTYFLAFRDRQCTNTTH